MRASRRAGQLLLLLGFAAVAYLALITFDGAARADGVAPGPLPASAKSTVDTVPTRSAPRLPARAAVPAKPKAAPADPGRSTSARPKPVLADPGRSTSARPKPAAVKPNPAKRVTGKRTTVIPRLHAPDVSASVVAPGRATPVVRPAHAESAARHPTAVPAAGASELPKPLNHLVRGDVSTEIVDDPSRTTGPDVSAVVLSELVDALGLTAGRDMIVAVGPPLPNGMDLTRGREAVAGILPAGGSPPVAGVVGGPWTSPHASPLALPADVAVVGARPSVPQKVFRPARTLLAPGDGGQPPAARARLGVPAHLPGGSPNPAQSAGTGQARDAGGGSSPTLSTLPATWWPTTPAATTLPLTQVSVTGRSVRYSGPPS